VYANITVLNRFIKVEKKAKNDEVDLFFLATFLQMPLQRAQQQIV